MTNNTPNFHINVSSTLLVPMVEIASISNKLEIVKLLNTDNSSTPIPVLTKLSEPNKPIKEAKKNQTVNPPPKSHGIS